MKAPLPWKMEMRINRYLWALALVLFLLGCGPGRDSAGTTASFPRAKTLYIGGLQSGAPNTFNPLNDLPAFPVGAPMNLMYEPLMVFNTLRGSMDPLLAKSYEITGGAVRVVLEPRARWSDNTPVTGADVKFSYEIGKRFKESRLANIWNFVSDITFDSVLAADGTSRLCRVHFIINKERNNPLQILDYFQEVHIVPAHVIEPLLTQSNNDFSAFLKNYDFDQNPVVSGPYNLFNFSAEKIVLKRRDDYWGNAVYHQNRLARPEYFINAIFKSNDHYSIALQQGNLDVSQTFIPRIWLKKKKKVGTWFAREPFYPPGSIPMLCVNVTRHPLGDKRLRRAMAAAINYNDISELAVSGYSPPLKPGLILPFGVEQKYYSEEDAVKYGTVCNPGRAKEILKEAGYVSEFDGQGNLLRMKDPAGDIVPTIFVKSPVGWTDWEIIVRIAVRGMRAVGIDARESFMDAGLYNRNLQVGDFDLILFTPSGSSTPSKPWSRFQATLSSRTWKPIGDKMNENQGRYNNPSGPDYLPAIDSLLEIIPSLPENEKLAAYRKLNVIYMQEQPTIPVVYRPEFFYEFSTRHWKGFPTEDNPYAPPQCLCIGAGTNALWEIEPLDGQE